MAFLSFVQRRLHLRADLLGDGAARAEAALGRRKIRVARGAYRDAVPWCSA